MTETVYTIPYGTEYWGSTLTEDDALRCAKILREQLANEFPEVEFRLVPERQSWNQRATGDEALIDQIQRREEDLAMEIG